MMKKSRTAAVLLGMALVAGLVSGCQSDTTPVDEPAIADTGAGEVAGDARESFAVGVTDLAEGRSRAVGVLGYSELEGGFWALYDVEPGEVPEGSPVVAVIANMGELDTSACSLEGKLVVADGVMSDGVSIRMAGPEIIADDVYEVPAE